MKTFVSRPTLAAFLCFSFASAVMPNLVVAESFDLPQDSRMWVNSPPVSLAAMEGKAIVLYFFEEGCPTCQAKWPEILQAATQMRGQPVMLIGVNSGTPPAEIAQYIRENRISIPIIIDPNRVIEQAAGVPEISLKNIYQARVIDPDGTLRVTNGSDIPGALEEAAKSASWNVDLAAMTPNLLPIWKQIEFGKFAGTGKLLARALHDRNPENKAAAEMLQAYVQTKIEKLSELAGAALSEGDSWRAYKLYEQLVREFDGYELPESVASELAKLKGDDEIRRQIDAAKQWTVTQRSIASGKSTPARTKAILSKLIEKYPGTEAAEKAQAHIDP